MPRLSILIPVYNAEPFLAGTIDSVLAQTYTDWELIIVINFLSFQRDTEVSVVVIF